MSSLCWLQTSSGPHNDTHKKTHTHTRGAKASSADPTGSDFQSGSRHVPVCVRGQGEEEVLKLLAKWEWCIRGASCARQNLPASAARRRKTSAEGDMWTCQKLNAGGNYTLPLGDYSHSLPSHSTSIVGLNGKFMFSILAGTFQRSHTHTMGPLLVYSEDIILWKENWK